VELSGQLDIFALEAAANELHRRHEMLRAVFVRVHDQVVQQAQSASPVSLHVLHLSPMPLEERRREAKRLMTEAARQPFDFRSGPVYRLLLIRLSENKHYLQLVVSHLIADGWSVALMIRELAELYRNRVMGKSTKLPQLGQSYLDYARRQRLDAASKIGSRNREYWMGQLSGAQTSLDLPTDKPRPKVRTQRGRRLYFSLSPAASCGIVELSRSHNLTPFMTLLAAYETLLSRCTGQEEFIVGTPSAGRGSAETHDVVGVYMTPLPIRANLTGDPTFLELMNRVRDSALAAYRHSEISLEALIDDMHLVTAPGRAPLFQVLLDLQDRVALPDKLPKLSLELLEIDPGTSMLDLSLYLANSPEGYRGFFEYNSDLFAAETIDLFAERLRVLIDGVLADPNRRLSELPLLSEPEQQRLLTDWNQTDAEYDRAVCIHELIEQQARRTPNATALIFQRAELSYQELDARSNQLARWLLTQGVGPETLVGLCVERSLEMVVGILGILKAGAAYVPIDQWHPRDRQRLVLEDSKAAIVLSQRKLSRNLPKDLRVVNLDTDWSVIEQADSGRISRDENHCSDENLAYVIYTSGSTGRPKGVMISHRNVANFFRGITDVVPDAAAGTFLAVTTISFDIAGLELLWTLASGFRVIIAPEQRKAPAPVVLSSNQPKMDFSLFYFECDEKQGGTGKYDLVLEGARFADDNRFAAVWTPERHFHPFGGLYPNPAVVMSAVAARTRHVGIRAGSVVLPLHNPIRVAEEWSVVDNVSGGRVGIAFAPGSHPNDFVFAPSVYLDRKDWMLREIETVRRLWRGETVRVLGGNGAEIEVSIFPRPVQPELPVWMTCIGLPSFQHAGEQGYNVLSHLLFHDIRELTEKIVMYRRARREAGHVGTGHVTLMVHTFVGDSLPQVRDIVYEPLSGYLRSSADMFVKMGLAQRFNIDVSRFDKDDLEAFVEQAFERFFDFNGLLGTPETCATMVETLRAIGVDEVACLIDFGVGFDDVMDGLVRLNDVRQRTNRPLSVAAGAVSDTQSLSDLILRHDVTHFQCTPSMARMLLAEPRGEEALAQLHILFVGGDTLPTALAMELLQHLGGHLLNMYGPTETTIWSTSAVVQRGQTGVPIGKPLANTRVYVLDKFRRPVPIGVPGELFIGGDGVARGYWERPDLTQERFPFDPFQQEPDRRMCRTGDRVRFLSDGSLEFLSRLDHQVKVRGHRIELGEIETVLARHPDVKEAVVLARTDSSEEKQLIGFVRPANGAMDASGLRSYLRERLPEYMVPVAWSIVEAFPLTPNQKIDRKALLATFIEVYEATSEPSHIGDEPTRPSLVSAPRRTTSAGPPRKFTKWRTNTERTLVQLWRGVLETDQQIGVDDNFFELGGHSLQAVMLVTRIQTTFGVELSLRDFFEAGSLSLLAARIDAGQR
jgi:natural product biosynthesis luciferase-like monooxygenase protein